MYVIAMSLLSGFVGPQGGTRLWLVALLGPVVLRGVSRPVTVRAGEAS